MKHWKLMKGETIIARNSEYIAVMNWRDKRNVYMLSTRYTSIKILTLKRKKF